MSTLTLDGKPLAQFHIRGLQSWNEVFGKGHWRNKQRVVKRWRAIGERLGLRLRAQKGMPSRRVEIRSASGKNIGRLTGHTHFPIVAQTRVLVLVKVVLGTERRYDVHNVFVKALFDGFSDAGLWVDDEWTYVPSVLFTWAEDVGQRGKHFVIEIHELDRYVVNGVAQLLPEGRGDDERRDFTEASGPARQGSDNWDWS
jgi:hypothetical protein